MKSQVIPIIFAAAASSILAVDYEWKDIYDSGVGRWGAENYADNGYYACGAEWRLEPG